MPNGGKLIVFEGIDGSGLSTHSHKLQEWLVNKGYKHVLLTDEPTPGPIGSLIRLIIGNFFDKKGAPPLKDRQDMMALLFAADRIYHVHQLPYKKESESLSDVPHEEGFQRREEGFGIWSALEEGRIVISNRFLLSSLAYQSVSREGKGLETEWLEQINSPSNSKVIPDPDLIIFLDVPPEIALKRIGRSRNSYEMYEDFLMGQVRINFKRAIERHPEWRVVRINGVGSDGKARSPDSVQDEIRAKVSEILLKKPIKVSSDNGSLLDHVESLSKTE
jgi:dTMP kinase